VRVQRRVNGDGRIMVTPQRLEPGRRNVGKQVTVMIEDPRFRIPHEGEETAVRNEGVPDRSTVSASLRNARTARSNRVSTDAAPRQNDRHDGLESTGGTPVLAQEGDRLVRPRR
jgi:hypothetical protein